VPFYEVSEAELLDDFTIPPLKQTIAEVEQEFTKGIFLKSMERFGKALIKCVIIGIPMMIAMALLNFLGGLENTQQIWFTIAILLIRVAFLLFFIFEIGNLIKNKKVRKRYFIYVSVFLGQFSISLLIRNIFDVDLENTWISTVGISVLFFTVAVAMFDAARLIKNVYLSCLLYFVGGIWTLGAIISGVSFLAGW
jgi:hypothetical protein